MVRLNNLRDPEVPLYVAITGAWNLPDTDSWLRAKKRTRSKKSVRQIGRIIRKEVKYTTKKIIESGNGVIVGGALGVDQIAAETALTYGDPNQLIVITPINKWEYGDHYADSWEKRGVISRSQAEALHDLLYLRVPQDRIHDSSRFRRVHQESYFARDQKEVDLADVVIGFHLDDTGGTADTLHKARQAGLPVYVRRYEADNPGWRSRFKSDTYNIGQEFRGWQHRLRGLDHLTKRKLKYNSN